MSSLVSIGALKKQLIIRQNFSWRTNSSTINTNVDNINYNPLDVKHLRIENEDDINNEKINNIIENLIKIISWYSQNITDDNITKKTINSYNKFKFYIKELKLDKKPKMLELIMLLDMRY